MGDTRADCRTVTRVIRPRGEEGQVLEEKTAEHQREKGVRPPRLYFPLSFLIFPLFGGIGRKETSMPKYDPEWFRTEFGHVEKPPLPWPFRPNIGRGPFPPVNGGLPCALTV